MYRGLLPVPQGCGRCPRIAMAASVASRHAPFLASILNWKKKTRLNRRDHRARYSCAIGLSKMPNSGNGVRFWMDTLHRPGAWRNSLRRGVLLVRRRDGHRIISRLFSRSWRFIRAGGLIFGRLRGAFD